jgi:DNA repair protein RadC
MSEEDPDHLGHRKRLRKKFREAGTDGFHDYELVELLLTYAIPRKDVKPIAKDLIDEFGSISGILEASPEQLERIDGMGEVSSTLFPLLKELCTEYLDESMRERDVLSDPEAVADFARAKIGTKDNETFMAIYLNNQNEVLDWEIIQEGTVDKATVYPRNVIQPALDAGATGLILVHNHPGGSLEPSHQDEKLTEELTEMAQGLDIDLKDHLLVTSSAHERLVNVT